jgi:deoxyribonuclease-4
VIFHRVIPMPIVFGTAGIPLSCPKRDSLEGIAFVKKLGLGAFEFEFVQSARMGAEKARACGEEARKLGVVLSAHAPYFINLCSEEKEKVAASKKRIIDTVEIMHNTGGGRVVIHSGFYGKLDKKAAFEAVKESYLDILQTLKERKLTAPTLAPEVTGKHSAFGSLEELYDLAADIGFSRLKPTIDFGHMHARGNGGIKSEKDYDAIFDAVEQRVGAAGTRELHCHFTGIRYSEKGELNHLPISSGSPRFDWLAEVLAARRCGGVIISESPLIEEDALKMKAAYEKALRSG